MPEGNDGWYTDSATVPANKYESYIPAELIPDAEKRSRANSRARGGPCHWRLIDGVMAR